VRVSRRRGRVRLQLAPAEAEVLAGLYDEVALALDGDALPADDPVRGRLFPAAYPSDGEADAEYRALTESSLRDERVARARACAAELRSDADISLAAEGVDRWIRALNDLRLALGTRLGITEDDPDLDDAAPDYHERSAYYWLTALQDSLVRAVLD